MSRSRKSDGRQAAEQRGRWTLLAKLPLLFSFSILGGSWISFILTITIPEVLLHRHAFWHFIEQLIVFNTLMGLTVLSLFTAATRSPGHPDPALAPYAYIPESDGGEGLLHPSAEAPAARSMSQTSTSKSRPPTLNLPLLDPSGGPSALGPAAHPVGETDPDDIPLRFLRNSQWVTSRVEKDRPSPLPLATHRPKPAARSQHVDTATTTPSDPGQSYTPFLSPFPLALSPFVPNTTVDAGEESDWADDEGTSDVEREEGRGPQEAGMRDRRKGYWMGGLEGEESDAEEAGMTLDQIESEVAQLLHDEAHHSGGRGKALMAKSNTGGPRFCRKCESWKPDRSHHCRFCKKCVLKMDHHCVWLATCIGHRNYKPFLLFISYGTLLAIYIAVEGVYQTYTFFTDTGQYQVKPPGSDGSTKAAPNPMVEFAPLVYMMLTMSAAFFTLAIGGLAGYHWFLVCNNLTTLEQISHTYPSALLPPPRPSAPNTGTSAPQTSWKPDHLLTRSDRQRLSAEAREINVYDLGWRRNIAQTLLGDIPASRGMSAWLKALWPLSPARSGDGHGFDYDEKKLERLRALTEELRLGLRRAGAQNDSDDEDEVE